MRRMIPDNQWKNVKSNVEALVGGVSTNEASTKKIYCHPIVLTKSGTPTIYSFIFLFNQVSAAYTTWDDLKEAFYDIQEAINDTARIGVTGSVYNGTYLVIASHLDIRSNKQIICYGIDITTKNGAYINLENVEGIVIYDGVNAIN